MEQQTCYHLFTSFKKKNYITVFTLQRNSKMFKNDYMMYVSLSWEDCVAICRNQLPSMIGKMNMVFCRTCKTVK